MSPLFFIFHLHLQYRCFIWYQLCHHRWIFFFIWHTFFSPDGGSTRKNNRVNISDSSLIFICSVFLYGKAATLFVPRNCDVKAHIFNHRLWGQWIRFFGSSLSGTIPDVTKIRRSTITKLFICTRVLSTTLRRPMAELHYLTYLGWESRCGSAIKASFGLKCSSMQGGGSGGGSTISLKWISKGWPRCVKSPRVSHALILSVSLKWSFGIVTPL